MKKTIIISPSGAFYGSEQTLYTFLVHTINKYEAYINSDNGKLAAALKKTKLHKVYSFKRLKFLYIQIFIRLLFENIGTVYCNEGAHIRYLKVLGVFFKKKKFVVHIRITEDTSAKRLKGTPPNLQLISVSKYIQKLILDNVGRNTLVLSSPHRGGEIHSDWKEIKTNDEIKIGIIGRITESKGVKYLIDFIKYCEQSSSEKFEFHFFGDLEYHLPIVDELVELTKTCKQNVFIFHGFIKRQEIYSKIDLVVHFNAFEPLGVIFFEALNAGKPFIGFNSGGIGNIAEEIGLSSLMVDLEPNWENTLIQKINSVSSNIVKYQIAHEKMLRSYSIKKYCETLEEIIG